MAGAERGRLRRCHDPDAVFPGWANRPEADPLAAAVPCSGRQGSHAQALALADRARDHRLGYSGASIFTRKRPLVANTLKRIAAGLAKFGGDYAEPFRAHQHGPGDFSVWWRGGGMSEIVTIGNATLYHGDCLELLSELEGVDHVISDPPYEDELHNNMGRIKRTDGQEMVQDLGFAGINAVRTDVAEAVVEVAGKWSILFCLAEGVRAWRDDLQAVGAVGHHARLGEAGRLAAFQRTGRGARFRVRGHRLVRPGHRKWNGGDVVGCSRTR